MILTAHQPGYLPWLGLFHKIALSELFCFFDIAQYQTKEFDNRNKIKTNTGSLLLTVPVESKDHFEKKLCDIKIINNGWNKKHIKSIQLAYQKAKFFKDYFDQIEAILSKNHIYLADLNIEIISFCLKSLHIDVPLVKASDYDFKGQKSDLVLDMCMKLNATDYIFGAQGVNYADAKSFQDKGINIYFQNYAHPKYQQLHGDFESYMSVIDLLFNEGSESLKILLTGNASNIHQLETAKS